MLNHVWTLLCNGNRRVIIVMRAVQTFTAAQAAEWARDQQVIYRSRSFFWCDWVQAHVSHAISFGVMGSCRSVSIMHPHG